jgi:HSP20 family protein
MQMTIRDLMPWKRGSEVGMRREENPFLSLHREMNRLFDDAFRGLGPASLEGLDPAFGWPTLEVHENDSEVKVIAELPGLDESNVAVELANGVLSIKGEKKAEVEENDRLFTERFYGRFERRIPVEGVEPDKVAASFKNGLLTVTLPKTAQTQSQVKRIAISGK